MITKQWVGLKAKAMPCGNVTLNFTNTFIVYSKNNHVHTYSKIQQLQKTSIRAKRKQGMPLREEAHATGQNSGNHTLPTQFQELYVVFVM